MDRREFLGVAGTLAAATAAVDARLSGKPVKRLPRSFTLFET